MKYKEVKKMNGIKNEKVKYSYLVDYADEMCNDQNRADKLKKTRERKRVEEHIAVAIMQNNPKRAIELCERYNIPPQDFGRMVAKYSQFPFTKEELKNK
jgi:hypothetical protein